MKPLKPARRINRPQLGKFDNHVHPFVVFVWEEIIRQGVELKSVGDAAGIDQAAFHKWRRSGRGPSFINLEAVLNALGYELKIVSKSTGRDADADIMIHEQRKQINAATDREIKALILLEQCKSILREE